MKRFRLVAPFAPTGDQPQAIEKLVAGVRHGVKDQVLLGVTGSGKTFTMAHVIADLARPTLVISPNKTLAAQLYQEFREFFPGNAVCYFVSYYDFYQPEAYIPSSDTYIEKETQINEEIDKLRLAATTNLLTRPDTIIVASVSSIYNIGSPREYGHFVLELRTGMKVTHHSILKRLVQLQYERNDYGLHRGTFRVRGEVIDLFPAYQDDGLRMVVQEGTLVAIEIRDVLTGKKKEEQTACVVYPAKHYMTDPRRYRDVFAEVRRDLATRVAFFRSREKFLEAQRIAERVNYDFEMIREVGYVNGIENYSRYFDGRNPGDPPYTLFDYFAHAVGENWLLFIDESHMTIPQIRGMYNGDRSRKQTLVDYGFRLPAALDNRPLRFEEFLRRRPASIYVSATPDEWECSQARESFFRANGLTAKNHGVDKKSTRQKPGIVEQLIRPTGLVDPQVRIRPTQGQIDDLLAEIDRRVKKNERVLVTTLTKRMAEDLATFISKYGVAVHYLHADIETLTRTDILTDLRAGKYAVVVGINLLREGLDLPEVSLVAVLDADKEGFLRSRVSLIQTMGRAARHVNGQVILYADTLTESIRSAIQEVQRRRRVQLAYNRTHGIRPKSIQKSIRLPLVEEAEKKSEDPGGVSDEDIESLTPLDRKKKIRLLTRTMRQASRELNFELAAELRDRIRMLEAS